MQNTTLKSEVEKLAFKQPKSTLPVFGTNDETYFPETWTQIND
jgi:hypothetical protein